MSKPVTWGIHSDQPHLDFVGNGLISVGWEELGDLREIGDDQQAMKDQLAERYTPDKKSAFPGWAGMLRRFAFEMTVGDVIVFPHKPDSTVNIGRIASDYRFVQGDEQPNQRSVEWIVTGMPRTEFSQSALYEIGAAITLFKIKNHAAEFLKRIDAGTSATSWETELASEDVEHVAQVEEDELSASRVEADSRDFIVRTLLQKLDGKQFEYFVASLLRAMGYEARVTEEETAADGGVDVIAHRDPIGLEGPLIKVQCKRQTGSAGGPDVQKLLGTLSAGGREVGLFVTLGSFSNGAKNIAKARQELRLIGNQELVDLVFRYYDDLEAKWQRLLPMRSVWSVDREHDG